MMRNTNYFTGKTLSFMTFCTCDQKGLIVHAVAIIVPYQNV